MLRIILLACLFLLPFAGQARQVYTIRDGTWENDSTWYNSEKPQGPGDTIQVGHKVVALGEVRLVNSFLRISINGRLCGIDTLRVIAGSYLENNGLLGFPRMYFLDNGVGVNTSTGTIYSGLILVEPISGGSLANYQGCIKVDIMPDYCQCTFDTALDISISEAKATFTTSGRNEYTYHFGDGGSAHTYEPRQEHLYRDTGYFNVELIIQGCCSDYDTLYRTIYIAPPPPVCPDTFPLLLGPNPADEELLIKHSFCNGGPVTIRLYGINGQLLNISHYNITEQLLYVSIDMAKYPSGAYVVDIDTPVRRYRKKVVVVHGY